MYAACVCCLLIRDAPIIGRFADNRYLQIVIYTIVSYKLTVVTTIRVPVSDSSLSDHLFLATTFSLVNGVVAQSRFYCNS